MATVEGQVSVKVAREENGAKVDFKGDGLNSTVYTNVSFRWNTPTHTHVRVY